MTVPGEEGWVAPEGESASKLLERMTDAFFSLNREGRLAALNPAAEQALSSASGVASAELPGRVIWEVLPALRGTRFEEECRGALAR